MKRNNLYSGLVTPSSGWWSPMAWLRKLCLLMRSTKKQVDKIGKPLLNVKRINLCVFSEAPYFANEIFKRCAVPLFAWKSKRSSLDLALNDRIVDEITTEFVSSSSAAQLQKIWRRNYVLPWESRMFGKHYRTGPDSKSIQWPVPLTCYNHELHH